MDRIYRRAIIIWLHILPFCCTAAIHIKHAHGPMNESVKKSLSRWKETVDSNSSDLLMTI